MKNTTGLYARRKDDSIEEIEGFDRFKEIYEEDDEGYLGYREHPIEFSFDDCFLYPINKHDHYDTFDYIRTEEDFLELFTLFGDNGLEYLDSLPLDLRISDSFNNSDYSIEEIKILWKIQERKELE